MGMMFRYEPVKQEKGVNEAIGIEIKEGDTFWRIKLEDKTFFDCKSQYDAEIFCRVMRIQKKLKITRSRCIKVPGDEDDEDEETSKKQTEDKTTTEKETTPQK